MFQIACSHLIGFILDPFSRRVASISPQQKISWWRQLRNLFLYMLETKCWKLHSLISSNLLVIITRFERFCSQGVTQMVYDVMIRSPHQQRALTYTWQRNGMDLKCRPFTSFYSPAINSLNSICAVSPSKNTSDVCNHSQGHESEMNENMKIWLFRVYKRLKHQNLTLTPFP